MQKTDIGMIPADWELRPLAELGEPKIGLTYSPADVRESGTLVLRSSNVQNDRLAFDDNVYVRSEIADGSLVEPGDILICVRNGSRALIGKCALIDESAKGMAFGAFMSVFRSPHSAFLFQQFRSDIIGRQIAEHLGATINQITNGSLKSFRVPFPPNGEERARIAQALSDIDDLIASMDGLIAKKRDVKQGAMQELLTGKRRLPSFSEEWTRWRYKDFVRHHAGNSFLIKGRLDNTGLHGRFKAFSASGQDVWVDNFEHSGDAIIVSAVGSRCGRCFAATGHWTAIANTHVLWIDGSIADQHFVFRLFDDESFWIKGGSGQPFVKFRDSFDREVLLPCISEQKEIAKALRTIDDELEALITRREKFNATRQGMMQQLLTGRIRLS